MKKCLTIVLLVSLLALPMSPLLADEGSVSFFEALSNFAKVEDYKLMQSFYGNAEFEEGEDHLTAEYRVTVNSTVESGSSENSFNRINATLKLINHNTATDSTPFKEMTVQANAEVIVQNQQDVYLKLNNFNVGLKDPLPFATADIEDVKSMVAMYQGTWFHSGAQELATENLDSEIGTVIDVDQYLEFENQFTEDPKEAILGLSEMILQDTDAGLSEEEMSQAMDAIKMVLEAKLFTVRPLVTGQNSGFKFFTLNKTAIVNVIEQFGVIIGEELTGEDETMIRTALSKVGVSGIYRMDDVNDLIDNLLVRLRIKETGPVKHLELNYRYKVSDLNKENNVSAPTDYAEWTEVTGGEESL